MKAPLLGLLLLPALAVPACNAFTGAADLTTEGGGGGLPTGGPALAPADDVRITRVEIYQGLQNTLMEDGAPLSPALPTVIGRRALFRIFYEATGSVKNVTARLTLGEEVIEETVDLSGMSNESSLDSTINLTVQGEQMTASSYRVDLLQDRAETSGTNAEAAYPADMDELADLPLANPNGPLTVRLVPVQYQADGSGRLPDTSGSQLQLYEELFFNNYPVAEIEIVVDAPFIWEGGVFPGGGGWSQLLDAITNYRQASGAASNEYVYGIFMPADDFGQYCAGGCISGLANLAGDGAGGLRAGIGLGFPGGGSAQTAVHEIGHTHGRQHTPCGTFGDNDPNIPTDPAHEEAAIGVWGYDLFNDILVDSARKDFMSYCDPTWVSDYTYLALLERIQSVNMLTADVRGRGDEGAEAQAKVTYQQVSFDGDGTSRWHPPVTIRGPLRGETRRVTVLEGSGEREIDAVFVPRDHLDGGRLLYPSEIPGQELRLRHRGRALRLTR
ncbi:MAG TPA: hypothetical protein ENK57_21885 [Polyangiaceae bacterium]|nr:hypothetical protein [Polyangiaceae bacterium]